MKFIVGALVALVACVAVGLLIAASGAVSVSATAPHGVVDDLLGYASRRSIAHHADTRANPVATDPSAVAAGLQHYKENCLVCHTVGGIEKSEIAQGLHPSPPMLTADGVQAMSDGELFWVVANGIQMTGMPAFSPTHDENELWQIVAFLRHLRQLTDDERSLLSAGQKEEAEHHHDHADESNEHHHDSGTEEHH